MPQLKHISDGEVFAVSDDPVWIAGIWECGDQRFTDPSHSLYETVTTPPAVPAAVFYDLFTVQEMIDIEAHKDTDPIVGQFYKRWQNAQDSGLHVDLGTPSVVAGLGYLATTNVPGSSPPRTYIAPARIAVIQTGIPQ